MTTGIKSERASSRDQLFLKFKLLNLTINELLEETLHVIMKCQ